MTVDVVVVCAGSERSVVVGVGEPLVPASGREDERSFARPPRRFLLLLQVLGLLHGLPFLLPFDVA